MATRLIWRIPAGQSQEVHFERAISGLDGEGVLLGTADRSDRAPLSKDQLQGLLPIIYLLVIMMHWHDCLFHLPFEFIEQTFANVSHLAARHISSLRFTR
ncbi:hypothetical protein SynSYN20_00209 [Synechococcus sp. SYN20]|nr:hypothetical protein SynSYN20_00209 [Synechococcus sp. SYN20]